MRGCLTIDIIYSRKIDITNIDITFNSAYCQSDFFILVYSIVCYVVIGIGVVLNIWSMLNYMIKNKDVLTKDKKTEE